MFPSRLFFFFLPQSWVSSIYPLQIWGIWWIPNASPSLCLNPRQSMLQPRAQLETCNRIRLVHPIQMYQGGLTELIVETWALMMATYCQTLRALKKWRLVRYYLCTTIRVNDHFAQIQSPLPARLPESNPGRRETRINSERFPNALNTIDWIVPTEEAVSNIFFKSQYQRTGFDLFTTRRENLQSENVCNLPSIPPSLRKRNLLQKPNGRELP